MPIQWYPGHMAKTKRMMREQLALVDAVVELLDARIPYSSQNPDIETLTAGKKRVILLNKADLAAPNTTSAWLNYFMGKDTPAAAMDALGKTGLSKLEEILRALTLEKQERQHKRGRQASPLRVMVAGIPNVGKSTVINKLAGRSAANTGDKPGVTRGRQWIKARAGFELLDTPGVLWPKFEEEIVGIRLAVTGAISGDILDPILLCEDLLAILTAACPASYINRYKLQAAENKTPRALLEMIGNARGFKMKGGVVDIERAAVMVLDEYRGGKLGRISLEKPE